MERCLLRTGDGEQPRPSAAGERLSPIRERGPSGIMLYSSSGDEGGRATALVAVPRTATRPGVTDVLLISPHSLDKATLERAISRAKWNVIQVHTCEEALAVMASVLVPVVICDREIDGGHWQQAMKTIFSSAHPAPVLLTTDAYDWRLWSETIDNGGFELAMRPFRGIEEKLVAAKRHWKKGRVRRTWDQFFGR